ncbi:MAG: branched-chain amino acid ABC transporter permease [Candidatus Atribacteria bacterium]|nr:branched-chain amino acid ABC transporter permease [Candidatus Atribacteria bacterium]MCK4308799.1 branched-chain amino acid ABC transporter permease [Candidatus Atribacteria bacterium]
MNRKKNRNIENFLLLFFLIIALLVPLIFGSNQYKMLLVTTVLLYGVMATSWNIIGGLAGQLDLGSFAYLGLGAFTSSTLFIRFNFTPWIGMILGGLVAVGFALLIGIPLFRFRIREVWYALTTCALVEILKVVFTMWEEVGGPVERYLPYFRGSLYHMRFGSYVPYYYIILGILIIALLVNSRINRSKLGYYLKALGEDETAAEVLGVNTRACKLRALVYYSFLIGVTGAVYANMYGYVHPSFFNGQESIKVAILGIVGGRGITYGPLLAALLLVGVQEFLRASIGGEVSGLYLVIYSVILILVVLFRPKGIATIFQDGYQKLLSREVKKENAK